jgi:hypothetical protein
MDRPTAMKTEQKWEDMCPAAAAADDDDGDDD